MHGEDLGYVRSVKDNPFRFLVAKLMLLVAVTGAFGEAIEDGGHNVSSPHQGVNALDEPGIHNLFALGTNVLSGSSPEGEEGFAALARIGVRTMISVDGAKPDVELARKHGIRYVHLPHGYDGIDATLQLRLARAGQTLPGPIFIHCHHGASRPGGGSDPLYGQRRMDTGAG